tara:strand:- start:167 stop:1039 length:873 start_codon:yes stop_codon:yes gene_type:complete
MFKRKDKQIKFSCVHSFYTADTIPHPVPSSKAIPEWYRKLKPAHKESKFLIGTAKRCIPFLDAVTQGYTILAWADIGVRAGYPYELLGENNEDLGVLWGDYDPDDVLGHPLFSVIGVPDGNPPPEYNKIIYTMKKSETRQAQITISGDDVGTHSQEQVIGAPSLKLPFGKNLYKLNSPWQIETPKGWSVQFKNPPNRPENGLVFFEGIVDSDAYTINVNFPFFWNGGDGEFLIEKGTPLLQVVPFKRDTLDLCVTQGDVKASEESDQLKKMSTLAYDRYRRLFWHKRKER